jgi:GT2 family glycosyltransferase/glycosyltransferase involved in cell wall biosynthesis
MRVLLVVHGFPPVAQGGTEIYADAHARTLRDRFDDEVLVLTREQDPSRPDYSTRTTARAGIRIVWINNTFRQAKSFAGTYRNDSIDAIAAGLIDDFAPDVAHIHHLTCLSTGIVDALATRRVPVFMTLHDYWLICHRGQLLDDRYRVCDGPEPSGCANCLGAAAGIGAAGFAGAAAMRTFAGRLPPMISQRLMSRARRISGGLSSHRRASSEARRRLEHMRDVCARTTRFFAPSEHIRRRFIQFGVPPDRIEVAPYGIEPRVVQTIAHPSSDHLRFGFIGSLMVSKAPHLIVEAFQRLPHGSATLDVFGAYSAYHGDDSYWPTLARQMSDGRVRFHGGVPHVRIVDVMSAIDVLVVPSIWPETSPIVMREALASGVPVVASRIGGIPETIQEGVNGLLFDAGDVDDLHRALSRLVNEPNLLDTLRQGIRPVPSIEEDVTFTRRFYECAAKSHVGRGFSPASMPALKGRRTVRKVLYAGTREAGKTAAIVLNYGPPDDAILAVRSLQSSSVPLDIFVVDNGSKAEHLGALHVLGDDVTVIQTGQNLGFSGGMNVGIREALAGGASQVFLVNSDMIVPAGCVDRLRDALDVSGAGIAGPVVLSRSVPDRVATLGISYRPSTGRMRHRSFGARMPAMNPPASINPVDAISGCAMLIRREVFDAIGLLDEAYFFSFEDLDFCFRARRAGFETVLAGDATAYHAGGRSIGADPRRLYYAARNHLRFAARNDFGGRPGSDAELQGSDAGLTPKSLLIVALNLAHALRARGGTLPGRVAAVARGTRDHLAGRYGEYRS